MVVADVNSDQVEFVVGGSGAGVDWIEIEEVGRAEDWGDAVVVVVGSEDYSHLLVHPWYYLGRRWRLY